MFGVSLKNNSQRSFYRQVKFLANKLGAAMVQMSDKVASEMIIRNLSGAVIFDSKINIM